MTALIDPMRAAVGRQRRALAAFRPERSTLRATATETGAAPAQVCEILERRTSSAGGAPTVSSLP